MKIEVTVVVHAQPTATAPAPVSAAPLPPKPASEDWELTLSRYISENAAGSSLGLGLGF